MSMTWILATVWEVLALCLALWITVKHFRELRKHSRKSMIGDCFRVLMKTHASYFARWVHNVNAVLLFLLKFCTCKLRCSFLSWNGLFVSNAPWGTPICYWPLHAVVICHFRRTGVTSNLRFMLGSLKSPYSCRYLCWDHASSLVCENAALNSRPK
jgi:hypothetical protein